jgi:hypothetical protein
MLCHDRGAALSHTAVHARARGGGFIDALSINDAPALLDEERGTRADSLSVMTTTPAGRRRKFEMRHHANQDRATPAS